MTRGFLIRQWLGVEPRDVLGHEDSLGKSSVCELQTRNDVANRADTRNICAQTVVSEDKSAIHCHADFSEAGAFGAWATSDSDEKQIGRQDCAVLESDRHARVIGGGTGEFGAGEELDAALAKGTFKDLRARFVLGGNQARQSFNDRDLNPERTPDAGKFDADDATTEHDRRIGNNGVRQRLVAGHDAPADFQSGKTAGV